MNKRNESLACGRNGATRMVLEPYLMVAKACTNKTMPIEWWNALVRRLPLPADSFGAAHEPPVEGCENYRGLPLNEVAGWLRQYEVLITTDNGLCAIAGALNCDIVLLESASSPALTGPQTSGKLEVVWSGTPPNWDADDVVATVKRILNSQELVQPVESGVLA